MPCGASAMCCGSRAVFHSIRARLTVWLVLRVYSLPARHKGHIVGVVVVAALRNKAATTPAAVGHILTADLDQALRVQAQQIAAVYDFDVLDDLAHEKEENQQSVDT